MKIHVSHPLWKAASAGLLAALLLQGCGGGSSSASNPPSTTSGTQLASGVVTGFGSVFVDGTEIEDANAKVRVENADGSYSNTVLQMGQRVRVNHDGKGTASQVTVDAAVIGTVSNVGSSTLTVAGQVVSVNADSATGSLTVWGGGYSSITDVKTSDLVEVHGTPVYDSTSKTYTVTATRVQKITASTGRMQVAGTISDLDTSAKTFKINGLTVNYSSAALRPANASLSNGTVVTAYAPLTTGNTITASNLKVNRLQDSSLALSVAQVGGQVSRYDSATQTFEVQGIKVTMTSSTSINPTGKTVKDGAYVNVRGTVGSDGSFTATNVQVRTENTSSDLATVKLIGVISDFVDASSFVVRGVPVDASNIQVATSCPGVTLGNDVPVQITATQQADTPVVLATKMSCQNPAGIIIRPVDGTISSVDSTAQTFALTPTGGSATTVHWTDSTAFIGVTTATMDTKQVRVEGYLSGSTLVARVVRATASSSPALDDDGFKPGNTSDNTGWGKYKKRKH